MRWLCRFALGMFILVLCAGCTGSGVADTQCPWRGVSGLAIRCVMMPMPLFRDRSPEQVTLAVAVIRASRPVGLAPVLYLEGGPGGSAIALLPYRAVLFQQLSKYHDVIVIDQRGAGGSRPSLACPEADAADLDMLDEPLSAMQSAAVSVAALKQCKRRFTVPLTAFTSIAAAQDAADVMAQLGYRSWHVYATSYGTKVAQLLARIAPERIVTMTLDGVVPIDWNIAMQPTHAWAAISAAAHACKPTQRICVSESDIDQAVRILNREPFTATVVMPDGSSRVVAVNGDTLMTALFSVLYAPNGASRLHTWVQAALVSSPALQEVAAHIATLAWNNRYLSRGLFYAVQCLESTHGIDATQAATVDATYPQLLHIVDISPMVNLCASWQLGAVVLPAPLPAAQPIPTLLIAGEFDPVTPAYLAAAVALDYSPSHLTTVAGAGHVPSASDPCVTALVVTWIEQQTVGRCP